MPPFPAEGNKGKERPKKLKETPAKPMMMIGYLH